MMPAAPPRFGFRRWYQRELTHCHLHLVLLLLATVALLASMEAFSLRGPRSEQLLMALCGAASAVVGAWALRRYLYLLMHAEHVAHQADCPGCQAHARWDLLDGPTRPGQWRVQCRQCGQRWDIDHG